MRTAADQLRQVRLVIPVKRLTTAKTRLSSHAPSRRAAAELLLTHTLQVATTCLEPSQVCVLTADEAVVRRAQAFGVTVLLDAATDLNSALHAALGELQDSDPEATVVVLVADLPRLRPAELWPALADAVRSGVPCHVADHHGTGTTFVSIPPGSQLPMVFGAGSARRFTGLGAVAMSGAPRGLSTDLDTPTDPFQLDYRTRGEQP
ncbi:2-phospho-L-lactate guanylyltransferase [Nocardia sp. NPDC055053]